LSKAIFTFTQQH